MSTSDTPETSPGLQSIAQALTHPPTGTTGKTLDPRGVNHPKHYNNHPSGVEAIEIVRFMTFNCGSAWKYMQRLGEKTEDGSTPEETMRKDLDKVAWYLKDELANTAPLLRTKCPTQMFKAAVAVINAEPMLVTQQFYTALSEYAIHGDQENLKSAIYYAEERRALV